MFNMVLGVLTFSMWGIALILFLLMLTYRKSRSRRRIFGSLAFLFLALPFLGFLGLVRGHENQKREYYGEYVTTNETSGAI
jgi:multisubunit Na+/H+ antiporter MnhB subunit